MWFGLQSAKGDFEGESTGFGPPPEANLPAPLLP